MEASKGFTGIKCDSFPERVIGHDKARAPSHLNSQTFVDWLLGAYATVCYWFKWYPIDLSLLTSILGRFFSAVFGWIFLGSCSFHFSRLIVDYRLIFSIPNLDFWIVESLSFLAMNGKSPANQRKIFCRIFHGYQRLTMIVIIWDKKNPIPARHFFFCFQLMVSKDFQLTIRTDQQWKDMSLAMGITDSLPSCWWLKLDAVSILLGE